MDQPAVRSTEPRSDAYQDPSSPAWYHHHLRTAPWLQLHTWAASNTINSTLQACMRWCLRMRQQILFLAPLNPGILHPLHVSSRTPLDQPCDTSLMFDRHAFEVSWHCGSVCGRSPDSLPLTCPEM
jgi:hypothetical protein